MPRKPKFRPEVKRIKLNPEQAVLACACYRNMTQFGTAGPHDYIHSDHTTGGVDFVSGFCSAGRVAHRLTFSLGRQVTTSAETNNS